MPTDPVPAEPWYMAVIVRTRRRESGFKQQWANYREHIMGDDAR